MKAELESQGWAGERGDLRHLGVGGPALAWSSVHRRPSHRPHVWVPRGTLASGPRTPLGPTRGPMNV